MAGSVADVAIVAYTARYSPFDCLSIVLNGNPNPRREPTYTEAPIHGAAQLPHPPAALLTLPIHPCHFFVRGQGFMSCVLFLLARFTDRHFARRMPTSDIF